MDISEIIKNRGTTQVKNPNYNPKAKKNKQPEFITVPDIYDSRSPLTNTAIQSMQTQRSISKEESDKYAKYGLAYDFNADMDAQLADAQSNWEKARNSLYQTVVSEIALGTLKGFSDLIDATINTVFRPKEGNDYTNPVTEKLQEWQDSFNQNFDIYTAPGVDIQNGGLGDFGWWMKNIPSVASSLTLLIPSRLVTGGVSKIASGVSKLSKARKAEKAIKAAETAKTFTEAEKAAQVANTEKKLNAFQNFIYNPTNQARIKKAVSVASDAILMRTMENYQEAHQTYTDMYDDAANYLDGLDDKAYKEFIDKNQKSLDEDVDVSDRDAVAKNIAKKAADRTFQIDYANTIFDVIQLYALRDIGKVAKNVKSSSVRALHKSSIKNAVKTSEAAAEDAAKSGTKESFKKVGNKIVDFTTGTSKLFLSEASEGVEEAVNYIAQQEGMTYGNTLLGKETDSTLRGFWNKRLMNYLGTAELQESAFWGLMGGVIFGAAGGALNRAQIYRQNKKRNELREKLGVNMPEGNNDWISMSEMPEIRAAKEAINIRASRLNQLQADLKTVIDDNKNPLVRDPNTGEAQAFSGTTIDAQKERVKAELIERYKTEMALDAMNSGTFDLLVDYFKSDEVKQAMIDNGVIQPEQADAFIAQTLRDLENVRKVYNNELAHVNYQVSALNSTKRFEDQIPIEYVQQIAKANVDKKLGIQAMDRQIARLETLANETPPLPGINSADLHNARNTIRLSQLIDAYGRLIAEENEVKSDPDLDEWMRAESLDDIKNQKEGMLNAIRDLYTITQTDAFGKVNTVVSDKVAGALVNALRIGGSYVKSGGELVSNTQHELYSKTDEEIVKEYGHVFEGINVSADTISQISRSIKQDIDALLDENGLYGKDKRLFDIFSNIADLETTKTVYARMIDSTQAQISKAVDVMHNRNNEVRKQIIKDAGDIIRSIHQKYLGTNEEAVEQAIIRSFFSDKAEATRIARENLTGTDENGRLDSEKLLDALNVINFSQGANRQVYKYISDILSEQSERYRRGRENSITSQNQPSASNNIQPNSNTQQPLLSPTSQGTPQIAQPIVQNPAQQQTPTNIKVVIARNGEIRSIRESDKAADLPAIKNADGSVELRISDITDKRRQRRYVNSPLFGDPDFDILNNDITVEVETNPVLIYDERSRQYLIREKGKLKGVNTQTGQPVNSDEVEEEQQEESTATSQAQQGDGSISSTGDQQSIIPPVPAQPQQPTTPIEAPPTAQDVSPEGDVSNELLLRVKVTVKGFIGNPTDQIANSEETIANNCANALKQTVDVLKEQPEFEGKSEEYLTSIVKPIIDNLQNAIIHIKQLRSGIPQVAGGLALASKYEEGEGTLSRMLTKAVDAFVEEYVKESLVPVVDGKAVVSLRDILAICNEANVLSTTNELGHLFDVVKRYLESPVGKAKYTIIDDLKRGRDTIINESTQTSEQLQTTNNGTISQRVNIYDLLNNARATNNVAFVNALKTLKAGDTLHMVSGSDELVIMAGNVTIGNLPRPDLALGGGYVQYNQGWRTEVALNSNGKVVSELKDVLTDIFTDAHPDFVNIRKLLVKAKVLKRTLKPADAKIEIDKLIQQFSQNPYIDTLVQDSISDYNNGVPPLMFVENKNSVNYDNLFNHLLYLWDYTTDNVNETNLRNKQLVVKANLNTWFNKMYKVYDTVTNMNQNMDVKVAYINEGEINRTTDDTEQDYDKLEFVQDAVPDASEVRLAITNRYGTTISTPPEGRPMTGPSSFETASTFITVFSRNTKPDFVKAYGLRYEDAIKNPMGSKLLHGAAAYLHGAVSKYGLLRTQDSFNDLEEALASVFRLRGTSDDIIPLFAPKWANSSFYLSPIPDTQNLGFTGLELSVKLPDGRFDSIRIYNHTPNGVTLGLSTDRGKTIKAATQKDNNVNSIVNELTSFIEKYTAINLSFSGIIEDNAPTMLTRGLIHREQVNGQFKIVVDIPTNNSQYTVHEEYDSYNDFIISNNLLRVNTFVGEDGTNFTPRGRNQRSNQKLEILIPDTTPVERNIAPTDPRQADIILPSTNPTLYHTVKNIINSNRQNAGLEIFKAIKAENVYQDLEAIANELEIDLGTLFPNTIQYDGRYNKRTGNRWNNVIAQAWTSRADGYRFYLPGDNKEHFGRIRKNTVLVGSRLVNMLSSDKQDTRNEGIRKLMHERLHQVFDNPQLDRESLFTEIEDIYNTFKQALNDGTIEPSLARYCTNIFAYLERKNVNRETLLEEFVVEGLTNKKVFNALNSIVLTNVNTNTKENLFTKFAKLIAKLFGWHINDDSLYAEMLNKLRDATFVNSSVTTEENKIDTNVQESETTDDSTNEQPQSNESQSQQSKEEFDPEEEPEGGWVGLDEDEDEDEDYVDPLDDAPFSAISENEDENGFKQVPSLASVQRTLLPEHLNNFQSLVDNGIIEYKCS